MASETRKDEKKSTSMFIKFEKFLEDSPEGEKYRKENADILALIFEHKLVQETVYNAVEFGGITHRFSHPILKRKREKKPGYRYEVLDPLGSDAPAGAFGQVGKVIATLAVSYDKERKPVVLTESRLLKSDPKKQQTRKERIYKKEGLQEVSRSDLPEKIEKIKEEAELGRKAGVLHSKDPVLVMTADNKKADAAYTVMRKVGDAELFEFIYSPEIKKVSDMGLFRLLKAIMEAYQEQIHKHSMVHSDIKPENLRIELYGNGSDVITDFKVYFIDFGAAHDKNKKILKGYTHGFMPEDAIQNNSSTVQSDIYALGRTFSDVLQAFKGRKVPDDYQTVWDDKFFQLETLALKMQNKVASKRRNVQQVLLDIEHLTTEYKKQRIAIEKPKVEPKTFDAEKNKYEQEKGKKVEDYQKKLLNKAIMDIAIISRKYISSRDDKKGELRFFKRIFFNPELTNKRVQNMKNFSCELSSKSASLTFDSLNEKIQKYNHENNKLSKTGSSVKAFVKMQKILKTAQLDIKKFEAKLDKEFAKQNKKNNKVEGERRGIFGFLKRK